MVSNTGKGHTKEEKLAAFSRLLDVQDRLRLQCPWDKKQTFESLRPNTNEETFELCDALMKRDYKDIKKELGDVLEHVMFYSIIGREDGEFDICDVCNQEADKLMFRHPFINWKEEGNWTVSNPDMFINEEVRQLVTNMAMGKPGIAQRMFTLTQEDEELAKTLTDLIHNLSTDKNKFKAHDALKKIYKYGILEAFIDGRIAYCINNNMEEKGQKRLKTKKLMKTNVNIENLLLY